MIVLFILACITFYNFQLLFAGFTSLEENLLHLGNVISGVLLIVTAIYKLSIERALSNEPSGVDEDIFFNKLERKSYSASYFFFFSCVLSLMVLTIGFILLRDSNPEIVLIAFILGVLSMGVYPGQKMMSLSLPNFKYPDPNTKDPIRDTLDFYDDGQKQLMFKSLYKLYFFTISAFVILIFALMFYSIFSGNSQIVSMIGIGILLLIVLNTFSMSLKPNKISDTIDSKDENII